MRAFFALKARLQVNKVLKTRLNLFLEDVLPWPRPPAQVTLPGAEQRRRHSSSEEMLNMLLMAALPPPGSSPPCLPCWLCVPPQLRPNKPQRRSRFCSSPLRTAAVSPPPKLRGPRWRPATEACDAPTGVAVLHTAVLSLLELNEDAIVPVLRQEPVLPVWPTNREMKAGLVSGDPAAAAGGEGGGVWLTLKNVKRA